MYDIPDKFVSEAMESNRIKFKGATRTSGVNYQFISTSSGETYNDTNGETGMLSRLASVLAPFTPTASVFNQKLDFLYGLTTGSANTYFVSIPAIANILEITNKPIYIKFNAINTGASTLNINSFGTVNIKYVDSTGTKQNLSYSMLINSSFNSLIYDGTDFVLLSNISFINQNVSRTLSMGGMI